MTIRECTLSDIEEVVHVAQDTYWETFGGTAKHEDLKAYADETYTVENYTTEFHCKDSKWYVAEVDCEIVGYMKINFGSAQTESFPENCAELQRIYILKKAKGMGIGSQFISIALNEAAQAHVDFLWLGVWEHNYPAQKFYQNHGFEPWTKHIFQVGDDAQTDFIWRKYLT